MNQRVDMTAGESERISAIETAAGCRESGSDSLGPEWRILFL